MDDLNVVEIMNGKKKSDRAKAVAFVPKRIDSVIRKLPENKFNLAKTMREEGYGPQYAKTGHVTIKKAIVRRIAELEPSLAPKDKYFDLQKLIEEYAWIAEQRKHIPSKLTAITQVLSKHNIVGNSETKESAPPLIIGIKTKEGVEIITSKDVQ